MKPTVKKRSSYLKALVERRARAAAEEERLLVAVGEALPPLQVFLEEGAERAMNDLHGK